ncbi:hypothetical protein DAMA08_026050 [Martiniozyma asiatica (nom. inval.)]|nr:hypothetical protein DAMA08_026050 [Martiniozyma asiatica]
MEPQDLINHHYSFQIIDGRCISGDLLAIDDQSNLLVTNAVESVNEKSRVLGLVSIRQSTISKVFIKKETLDLINCTSKFNSSLQL